MTSDKKLRVALRPKAIEILFSNIQRAVDGNPTTRKCLAAANDELGAIVKAVPDLGGQVTFRVPKEETEYEFSNAALVGFRMSLVQAIIGNGQHRPPANFADRRDLLEISAAFGSRLLESVKKGAGLDQEDKDQIEDLIGSDDEEEPANQEDVKKAETTKKAAKKPQPAPQAE